MLTKDVRRKFLKYFKEYHHSIISSSPVVPHDDPTLLFTNAGMNQFKDVFLGQSARDYSRAATSQKCIRVGGKHNDLENVGHTSRHLTFFEMLGNFSFGDYFKKEAIKFAWDVSTQIFEFAPEKIWPTVFRDDEEAFELWTAYVPPERITRFGEKDNFWVMGETGPCGPCSELYFDKGEKYGKGSQPSEDIDGERFLEFWNLVFMQYNRDASGVMHPLPKPSIDTGAGLERIISLKMNVDSVFETDVLRSLISTIEHLTGIAYDPMNSVLSPAFRVIADHLRCLAFAIADGIQPSNVDRGYVLRKILRRAVRYGRNLGMQEPFLAKILPRLIDTMGHDYPELQKSRGRIEEILTSEEEAFIRTLRRGGNILSQIIEHAQRHGKKITGDEAFKLKDTYGFPIEEILLIARDANLVVDTEKYRTLEQEAKERSRSVHQTTQQIASENLFVNYLQEHGPCEFWGYTEHAIEGSHITALVINGKLADEMHQGEEGMVILDRTPFYAEMGGQVGDSGTLSSQNQLFCVDNCVSPFKGVYAHTGRLEAGALKVGDIVSAMISTTRRQKIANNHTATHLLHWALQKVLGEHIKQAGSVVDAIRLRFDFSHHKAMTAEELHQIEDLVNAKVRENLSVKNYEIPYEDAQKRQDIKQFFGEKYSTIVRVIDIEESKELCGGTHTTAVGTIGLFRIVKESSIAAGVRRIEAVTGEEAEALVRQNEMLLDEAAAVLKTQPLQLKEKIERLLLENKQLTQELKEARRGQLEGLANSLLQKIEIVNHTPLLTAVLSISVEELRSCAEEIMNKFRSGLLLLAIAEANKCHIIVRATSDLVNRGIKANEIIKIIAPMIEGSGGGRPDNAQAGGKAPQKIEEAFSKVRELLIHAG